MVGPWLRTLRGYEPIGDPLPLRGPIAKDTTTYTVSHWECGPLVTFVIQLLQTSRWFRRRRTVGFDRADRAFGAVESNCLSSSKSSRTSAKVACQRWRGCDSRWDREYIRIPLTQLGKNWLTLMAVSVSENYLRRGGGGCKMAIIKM